MLLCSLSILSFSSSCLCNFITLSFNYSKFFLFLEVISFSSSSSLTKKSFYAFSSSFFFFYQVCSISRVSSSFIFWMGFTMVLAIWFDIWFDIGLSWLLARLLIGIMLGVIKDYVNLLLMNGGSLITLLLFVLLSASILIMEQYSFVFFLFASSRKIYLYYWEVSEFLSISSNFNSWYWT